MGMAEDRALLALALTTCVAMTGFGLIAPVAPFLADALGATPSEVTWAIGAFSVGQLLSAPVWGRLSDSFGRKPALIGSLLLSAGLYLALAFVDSALQLAGVRFAAGLAAGNVATAFAAAADLSNPQNRARAMGLLGAGLALGFILGPALGGLLAGEASNIEDYQRVCFAACAVSAAAALSVAALLPETRNRDLALPKAAASFRSVLSRPAAVRLLGVSMAFFMAFAIVETIVALWAEARLGWGAMEVGLLLGAVGLFAALLQGAAAGPAAERLGERKVLLGGLICFGLGLAILIPAASAWSALLGGAVLATGFGLANPSLQSLVSKSAPESERGALIGVNQAAASLGRVLGPAVAGPLFEFLAISAPYAFAVGLALLALWLAHAATRSQAAPHSLTRPAKISSRSSGVSGT